MDNVVKMFQSPETLDDWKAYIAEANAAEKRANRTKFEAIIEKGKRIAEFHDAFRANGQSWGRRWDELCQEIIGLDERTCGKYEIVAKNIPLNEGDISFPGDVQSLCYLVRARKANEKIFQEAIAAGEITPKTNRDKAEAIMRRAVAKLSPATHRNKDGVPVWGKHNRPVIIPSKKTHGDPGGFDQKNGAFSAQTPKAPSPHPAPLEGAKHGGL